MKKPLTLSIAAIAIALSGCAQQIKVASEKAAETADSVLVGAEFTICRAATVGSVLRRYGAGPRRMAAWRALCQQQTEALPFVEETAP